MLPTPHDRIFKAVCSQPEHARGMDIVREVVEAPNGLEALAQVMRYILEVNKHVASEALQALLEREIGPEAKDTIMPTGQQLIEQGRKQGIEQCIERGVAHSLVDICEARFGAMPQELCTVIDATHDESTLRTWVRLASTREPGEIAAAICAAHPS
jgi:hypothetical protein